MKVLVACEESQAVTTELRRLRRLETDWETGEEVFHWWMEDGVLPGQMEFTDEDLEV